MKIDRFSIVVIAIVLALIVAAVIAVNRTDGEVPAVEYLDNDSPEAPVQNAFLALQEGATSKAKAQYSTEIVEGEDSEYSPKPWSGGRTYYNDDNRSRRLRILSAEIDESDPDLALVTFTLDTYYRNNGLFGSGSSYSSQRTVEVVREEGEWKINTPEFFD